MPSPYIIAGAAAGVALLGYGLMRKVKAGTLTKAEKEKTFKAAYDAGFSSGKDDGTADAGKVHNPRGLLNYSDVKEVQQQYDNGYNDGYEKFWTAPPKVDVTLDSSPSAGGKTSTMSAYDYGCSRGTSSGRADGASGADSSWGYNLETAGSKKRQAESGNPAEYRDGYKRCYIAAYATAYAAKGTLSGSEGKLSDPVAIDWFSVSGLSAVGSLRLKQRAQQWSGGRRISATSGGGAKYAKLGAEDGTQIGGA